MSDTPQDLLNRLAQAKKKDPNFDKAIEGFARAEVKNKDPLEGKVIKVKPKPKPSK